MLARGEPGGVAYWFVFLLHVALLWSLPFFPSQDGPTHVYNALILRDLSQGGPTYGAFYDLHLSFTPNLGAVAPLYGLMSLFPPLVAEKVFLTLVLTLLVGVMPRLARVVGGDPHPGAFVVFALLNSAIVLHGFYSLLLGQALFLWALWIYWRVRARPFWQVWVITTCSAAVLLFCHLLPFACYLLAVGMATLLPQPSARPFLERVRTTAGLLAVPALLLAANAWSLSTVVPSLQYGPRPVTPALSDGFDWQLNLVGLIYLVMLGQPALAFDQMATGFAIGVVLVWLLVRPGTRLSCRWPASGSPVLEAAVAARRWLLAVSAVLVAAMVIVPDAIGELALIKIRFPSFVCLLLVPLVCCVTPLPGLRRALMVACLVGVTLNGWHVVQAGRQMQALVTAGPHADVRGRFVAGYLGTERDGLAQVLLHATSYYCAVHGCVDLGNYQAFLGHFFVSFKPDPTLAVSVDIDAAGTTIPWERYPRVSYLRGWGFAPAERARVSRTFELVGEAGQATVWRRRGQAADGDAGTPPGGAVR